MRINDAVLEYVACRLACAMGVAERQWWEFRIVRGYYGEEVGGVTFSYPAFEDALSDLLGRSREADDSDLIGEGLVAEYGRVLDDLVGAEYEIRDVGRSKILVGREDRYAACVESPTPGWMSRKEITCLVLEENGVFRLIDGYHRLARFDKYADYAAQDSRRQGKRVRPKRVHCLVARSC